MLKKIKAKIQKRLSLPALKKHQVLGLALLGIIILLFISQSLYQKLMRSPEISPASIRVQTIRVKEAPMPKIVETVGTLTANTELSLKAGASGKVQKRLVDGGTWVKAGTLLAHMIAAPEVRAPFDGYLTDWQVKEGEYVSSGTPLIELVNTDVLSLTYKVPENFAPELANGQKIEVSVKALPDQTFSGIVNFISPIVDRKTYTILIKATIPNLKQALWPGMSAYVRHVLKIQENALIIPEACLILTLEGHDVFMVVEGKIQKRAVIVGEKRNGRVQILDGVKLGDAVILTRTYLIQERSLATAEDWAGDW